MNQKDKKKIKLPEKKWFDVRIECTVPATFSYRIFAENPEEAVQLVKNKQPNSIQYRIPIRKEFKLTVYKAGTYMIEFVKNLMK